MTQAADLLSAIHNSLHHGIQAQNDTTKGGMAQILPFFPFLKYAVLINFNIYVYLKTITIYFELIILVIQAVTDLHCLILILFH